MASSFRHPRGTRAALTALAGANGLLVGQVYLISDESRLAVATAVNAFEPMARQSEAGGGSGAGVHAFGALPVGRFAGLPVNASALSTIAAAANRLDLMPFIAAQDFSIDQLGAEVTTAGAAATLARLGLYASAANGEPGALIVQGATTLDTATTGGKTTSVASTALAKGTRYWLAILSSGAPTWRGVAVAALLPLAGDASVATLYTLRRASFAFAALPANAPATTLTSAIAPHIRLRRSA